VLPNARKLESTELLIKDMENKKSDWPLDNATEGWSAFKPGSAYKLAWHFKN